MLEKFIKAVWTIILAVVLFGAFAFALACDVVMAWINF